MKSYKCENCDEMFRGEGAKEKIIQHLLDCAVIEMDEKPYLEVEKELKETYDFIESVAFTFSNDFEEHDKAIIKQKDGVTYKVVHRYKSFGKENEKPLTVMKREIDAIQKRVCEVLEQAKKVVPEANVRFTGIHENSGYAGNGYIFSFDVNGQVKTITMYKDYVQTIMEKIKSYYRDEATGVLKLHNLEYSIDGVAVSEWLQRNLGKNCTIQVNDEK